MSAVATQGSDYRYAQISELGMRTKRALKPTIPILAFLLICETVYQIVMGRPGGFAFGLLSLGTCIALAVWRKSGTGLPLMPMIVVQHLIIYGLPLIVTQTTMASYSADDFTKAGTELFVFLLTLAIAWRVGIRLFRLSPPVCYGLQEFKRGGEKS